MDYLRWYEKESSSTQNYSEMKELIEQFKNTYIYIKKYEHEYGREVVSLCSKTEQVLISPITSHIVF